MRGKRLLLVYAPHSLGSLLPRFCSGAAADRTGTSARMLVQCACLWQSEMGAAPFSFTPICKTLKINKTFTSLPLHDPCLTFSKSAVLLFLCVFFFYSSGKEKTIFAFYMLKQFVLGGLVHIKKDHIGKEVLMEPAPVYWDRSASLGLPSLPSPPSETAGTGKKKRSFNISLFLAHYTSHIQFTLTLQTYKHTCHHMFQCATLHKVKRGFCSYLY